VPFVFLRSFALMLFLFRIWRRLPASQRRRMLWAASRYAPVVAAFAVRQARARARRRL
jgi:hypothetical protein